MAHIPVSPPTLCIAIIVVLLPSVRSIAMADDAFDKQEAKYLQKLEEAKTALEIVFTTRIRAIQNNNELDFQSKKKAIDALEAEQSRFKNRGYIPFSPEMRDSAMTYLQKINTVNSSLATLYSGEIKRLHRKKEVNRAQEINDKLSELDPIVGEWECRGVNFRRDEVFHWTLYASGCVNSAKNANGAMPKGWEIYKGNGIMIRNFSPGAPAGGFQDSCVISWDGVTFEAKNQLGGVYVGKLK